MALRVNQGVPDRAKGGRAGPAKGTQIRHYCSGLEVLVSAHGGSWIRVPERPSCLVEKARGSTATDTKPPRSAATRARHEAATARPPETEHEGAEGGGEEGFGARGKRRERAAAEDGESLRSRGASRPGERVHSDTHEHRARRCTSATACDEMPGGSASAGGRTSLVPHGIAADPNAHHVDERPANPGVIGRCDAPVPPYAASPRLCPRRPDDSARRRGPG